MVPTEAQVHVFRDRCIIHLVFIKEKKNLTSTTVTYDKPGTRRSGWSRGPSLAFPEPVLGMPQVGRQGADSHFGGCNKMFQGNMESRFGVGPCKSEKTFQGE